MAALARRKLVPRSPVEEAAASLGRSSAPLFEEKWHLGVQAAVSQLDHPFKLDWTGCVTGFTARDNPVNSGQVK
jgi:hypothetical protein